MLVAMGPDESTKGSRPLQFMMGGSEMVLFDSHTYIYTYILQIPNTFSTCPHVSARARVRERARECARSRVCE